MTCGNVNAPTPILADKDQHFVPLLYILVERLGLIGAGLPLSSRAVAMLLGQLWPTLHLLGQEGVIAPINTPSRRKSSVTIR